MIIFNYPMPSQDLFVDIKFILLSAFFANSLTIHLRASHEWTFPLGMGCYKFLCLNFNDVSHPEPVEVACMRRSDLRELFPVISSWMKRSGIQLRWLERVDEDNAEVASYDLLVSPEVEPPH